MILNHAVEPKTYCMKQARILTPTSNSNWRSIRLLSQTWIFSSEFFSRLVFKVGGWCWLRVRKNWLCQCKNYRNSMRHERKKPYKMSISKICLQSSSSTSVTKINDWHCISLTLMLATSSWWQIITDNLINLVTCFWYWSYGYRH